MNIKKKKVYNETRNASVRWMKMRSLCHHGCRRSELCYTSTLLSRASESVCACVCVAAVSMLVVQHSWENFEMRAMKIYRRAFIVADDERCTSCTFVRMHALVLAHWRISMKIVRKCRHNCVQGLLGLNGLIPS